MIRLAAVAFIVLLTFPAFSQKSKKSASYEVLKRESTANEMNTLLEEATVLRESSPSEALERVKEALAISLIRQDVIAESRCYTLMGEINLGISEWQLARDNFSQAYARLNTLKVVVAEPLIAALSGLAKANLELGNYSSALENLQALRAMNPETETLVKAAIDESEVYYRQERYDDALEVLAAAERRKTGVSPLQQARIDNQRARIYARTKQVEESVRNLQLGQNTLRSNTGIAPRAQEKEMRSAKDDIAQVLDEQKRYDEKIDLLNSSIDYNTDVKNFGEVARDKVELGSTLIAKGNTSEALRELRDAALIADTISDPKKQAEAFLSLAELHRNYGNTSDALATYRKYSEAVARNEAETEKRIQQRAGLIKTQRDIGEISSYIAISKQEEQLAQAMVFRQKLIIYGLILIIVIIAVTSFFIYKSARASRTANQLLALKSLRSQMNPHFIFNALNSVNHFVAQQDERAANKFLTEFSRLMRLVLENSQLDFIPLSKEKEIISLYLKLEHYRFRDKFDYEIAVDDEINSDTVEIPPMLVQPYIENAVWHGLRYRESKGFLSVKIEQQADSIVITVSDNGIGRRRSAELKTENQQKHQSTGLRNIRERLEIINSVYRSRCRVEIHDISEDGGTVVTLYVPVVQTSKVYA